jgi:hypothetical protein
VGSVRYLNPGLDLGQSYRVRFLGRSLLILHLIYLLQSINNKEEKNDRKKDMNQVSN